MRISAFNAAMTQNIPSRVEIFLRSTLYWVLWIVSTLLLTFPVIISAFTSETWSDRFVRWWVVFNIRCLEKICRLGFSVEGEENIPAEPCIIFSKHQSTWETLYIKLQFPKAIYVAKRELALIPFFGWAIASLKFILIDRSSGRMAIRQMIDQYRKRKKEGHWLVIFPEGTRKAVGEEPNYKIGGAVVAVETDSALLPLAVNAGEFWPRHSFLKWPGEISVSIGPPVYPDGRTAEELRDEAANWIEAKMQEITVLDRFPY